MHVRVDGPGMPQVTWAGDGGWFAGFYLVALAMLWQAFFPARAVFPAPDLTPRRR